MSEVIGLVRRIRAAIDIVYREVLKFGAVGLLAYVVDIYVYNLMRVGVWPLDEAPLGDKPLASKVVSVSVAMVVAWLGNRYWTFRHRRRATKTREFVLFAVMNVGGLLIALACLWISHYALGFTSALADNISGNVVGLGLGTLFRFWAYRQFVFTDLKEEITVGHGPAEHEARIHRHDADGPGESGVAEPEPAAENAADNRAETVAEVPPPQVVPGVTAPIARAR